MDPKEALVQLRHLYQNKDWFADVGTDQYGRFVVYIKYTCEETLRGIADYHEGVQVVVHLDASRTATRDQFTSNLSAPGASIKRYVPEPMASEPVAVELVDEDKSLRHLTDELDKLEKLCGTNTLQDIFYEIHDGENSVTNLSARYPTVRKSLDRLYDEYGFDVIYEEMDG
jgi:hypothetical protein